MRAVRIAVAAAAVIALSGVALFSTADAGVMPGLAAPLTINKVVEGAVPPGTTFSVLVACDGDIIDDGMGIEDEAGGLSAQGKGPGGVSSAVVTFDETGAPTSAPNPIGFVGPGTCTVTETAAGGASTIGYTCDGQIPADERGAAGGQGRPLRGGWRHVHRPVRARSPASVTGVHRGRGPVRGGHGHQHVLGQRRGDTGPRAERPPSPADPPRPRSCAPRIRPRGTRRAAECFLDPARVTSSLDAMPRVLVTEKLAERGLDALRGAGLDVDVRLGLDAERAARRRARCRTR